MDELKLEDVLIYGAIFVGVYFLLTRAQATGVTEIPTNEPLRLVPEPPSLVSTIPPLRGDTG